MSDKEKLEKHEKDKKSVNVETKEETPKKKKKRVFKSISKEQEELIEAREKRQIIETTILVILAIFLLILLCNKTFFKNKYENSSMYIELPKFTYFMKDEENEITLTTIRKSKFLKEYFGEYLSTLDYYYCDGRTIYYDKKNKTSIFDIEVKKTFAIKTIKIKYSDKGLEDLCVGNPYIDPIIPEEEYE